MTSRRSSYYVTEAPFPSTYVAFQEPKRIALAAQLAGVSSPDVSRSFCYCELGCGDGTTLNMLAATHPQARFFGVDFNPEHIDRAVASAREYGLENVEYLCRDFSALSADEFPELDYVASHGTYCWLPDDTAVKVREFAATALRQGGMFYVDTMMLPAKSSIAPVWKLMRYWEDDLESDPLDRVRSGVKLFRQLEESGSVYFSGHPSAQKVARSSVKNVLEQGSDVAARHIAHHALSEQWRPVYFFELAAELRAHGFTYGGSADHWLNVDQFWGVQEWQALKGSVVSDDRERVETLKDYWLNIHNRHSVFVKTPGEGDPANRGEDRHFDTFKALGMIPAQFAQRSLALNSSGFTVELSGPVFDWIIERLWRGGATLSQLIAESVGKFDPAEVERALNLYLATSQAVLLNADEDVPEFDRRRVSRLSIPLRINRIYLERSIKTGKREVLGSVSAGGGVVPVSSVDACLLYWLLEESAGPRGEAGNPIDRVDKYLRSSHLANPLTGAPLKKDVLMQAWQGLLVFKLRNLVCSGVVSCNNI